MQHTTNYNLSQYDATDRVTRDAFNADNLAIDAALKSVSDAAATAQSTANAASSAAATAQAAAAAGALVKLKTVTVSAATNRLDIDLSNYRWDNYERLFIFPSLIKPTSGTNTADILLENLTSGYMYRGSSSSSVGYVSPSTDGGGGLTSIEIAHDAFRVYVHTYDLSDSGGVPSARAYTISRSLLSDGGPASINFVSFQNSMDVGSYVIVYGLRK